MEISWDPKNKIDFSYGWLKLDKEYDLYNNGSIFVTTVPREAYEQYKEQLSIYAMESNRLHKYLLVDFTPFQKNSLEKE